MALRRHFVYSQWPPLIEIKNFKNHRYVLNLRVSRSVMQYAYSLGNQIFLLCKQLFFCPLYYAVWGGRTIAVPAGTPLVVSKNDMIYRDEMSCNTNENDRSQRNFGVVRVTYRARSSVGTSLQICRICDYRELLTPRQQKTE